LIKFIIHFVIIISLTALTLIGGIIYLVSILFFKREGKRYRLKRFVSFLILYLVSTFLVIPYTAPFFGRMKIENNAVINSHNFMTQLLNRNYVSPKLHTVLEEISLRVNKEYPEIKLIYLDANFPFFDGFPLLPHLSHNDGNKIDISFIYDDQNGKITNSKPSNSGYGVFEKPLRNETNQTYICKTEGFCQYDYPKYLTFGTDQKLQFNSRATKKLIQHIVNHDSTEKVFIEPHLKNRLGLTSSKIRFHGCKAVRHDDHIHLQVK